MNEGNSTPLVSTLLASNDRSEDVQSGVHSACRKSSSEVTAGTSEELHSLGIKHPVGVSNHKCMFLFNDQLHAASYLWRRHSQPTTNTSDGAGTYTHASVLLLHTLLNL